MCGVGNLLSDTALFKNSPLHPLHTACAACLTESGFMDCKESLEFLLSDEGKTAIVQLHVDGIIAYVLSQNQD